MEKIARVLCSAMAVNDNDDDDDDDDEKDDDRVMQFKTMQHAS